jgi:hypothetical protein
MEGDRDIGEDRYDILKKLTLEKVLEYLSATYKDIHRLADSSLNRRPGKS